MYLLPQQIKLFEGLEEKELLDILDQLPLRNYRKGLDVFQQGEPSREVFGILRGKIEILHQPKDGPLQEIAVLGPGDFFGEFSYLTGDPRSSSAVAAEDAVLMEMSENWLRAHSERFESFQTRLIEMYRKRVLSNVLRKTKLFRVLEAKSLEELGGLFRYRLLEANTPLMREGESSAELVILKSGELRVLKKRGRSEIQLGEIRPGEVVGEMALITGKPRSASVLTSKKSEIMVLEEGHFRDALEKYSELYRRLREVVEFRAAKTREILDGLADELAPGVAHEAETVGGLGVKALDLRIEIQSEADALTLSLEQISSQNLLLGTTDPIKLSDGSKVSWSFARPKRKSLQILREAGKLSGILFSKSKETVEIQLDPSLRGELVPMIQAMAKAKLQGLVYPEYPIEDEGVFASFPADRGALRLEVLAASQTGMRLKGEVDWPEGKTFPLKLFRGNKEILEIPMVCLQVVDQELEVQYEYDSEESKNQIEAFLRQTSGASRARLALEESRQAKATIRSDLPVLKRDFRSPQEFVKTYLSSIDQGFIKLKSREVHAPGTPVRLMLTIQDGASKRKALCEGIVKSSRGSETVLDLAGSEGPLQERLQRLCQKIIDEKAQTEWKGREATLREASYTVSGNIPDWFKVASVATLLAANIALYVWIYAFWATPRF